MKKTVFLFCLYLVQLSSLAQIAPKYSNEFLAIGVGARAIALSNTQTAIVEDVSAGYWNPAGLSWMNNKAEIGLMHSSYFGGIANYNYLGIAAEADSNTKVAFSMLRFGVDDIPDTRFLFNPDGSLNYDNIQSFSAVDYAFLFSVARKSQKIKGLSIGGNAKIIYRNVGIFANAWGFGLDAGIQYRKGNSYFGAMGRDITSTFNAWTINTEALADVFLATGNVLPSNSIEITLPKLLLDYAYRKDLGKSKNAYLLASIGADITFDGKRNVLLSGDPISLDPHLGLEWAYKAKVFIRAGIGNYQKIKDFYGNYSGSVQPNLGLGFRLKSLHIDYAMTNIGNVSEVLASHIVSLKIDLQNGIKL